MSFEFVLRNLKLLNVGSRFNDSFNLINNKNEIIIRRIIRRKKKSTASNFNNCFPKKTFSNS